MYHKSQEPLLRQQERLWNISEDIHQINENIVSSSDSPRKQNTRSVPAVIFILIFTYHTKRKVTLHEKIRCAIYDRVSSKIQATSVLSLDTQKELLTEYA